MSSACPGALESKLTLNSALIHSFRMKKLTQRGVANVVKAIRLTKPLLPGSFRRMASVHDSIPHTIRTANDPRQTGLYNATLSHIEQVNSKIRLLRLSLSK